MPRCISLSALALVAVAGLLVAGCGSSRTSHSPTTSTFSARQAAAHRKLVELRNRLHRRQRELRAQQAREEDAEGDGNSSSQASSSGGGDSFAALERELGGEIGAVIGPPGGQAESFGSLTSGSAWSTSKVPIVLRLLQDVGGPSGLDAVQSEETRRALTLSDNEAAAALFTDLEHKHGGVAGASAAVTEVLREGGDGETQISTQGRDGFSTYGQTEWSLANQQRFISALASGCIGSQDSREYVLNLMGEVSSDSWGLGSAGLPARWKGGWGPSVDGRYLVRQMGILYVDGSEAVVTLAAIPSDGQFETAGGWPQASPSGWQELPRPWRASQEVADTTRTQRRAKNV